LRWKNKPDTFFDTFFPRMRQLIRDRGWAESLSEPRPMTMIALIFLSVIAVAACSSLPDSEPSSDGSDANANANAADEEQRRLVASGRSQFLHCNSCHAVDAAGPPPFGADSGPHLENIVGRPAGTVEGFAYTETLRGLGLVWDEETLDQWLQQPHAMVPGMCEPFMGIANPEYRKALIAYLKSPSN
jgi:cytochrome c